MKLLVLLSLSFVFFLNHPFTGLCQTSSDWRGEGRTGVYNETGLLKKWPEGGPEMLWSVTGLAKGNSSVAIGDGKLYTTSTKDSIEVLMAFDRKGNKLWEIPYGRAWMKSFRES